jgi:nitrite reductase/ring-hydroxylating ferredoxin subunit
MKDGKLMPLCGVSDVAPGCALRAEAGGRVYAVFKCTHGPGSLSEGYILDDEIECPFHQGRFHIPSGRATCAPATEPLKVWTVRLVEGKVCIDPTEHR